MTEPEYTLTPPPELVAVLEYTRQFTIETLPELPEKTLTPPPQVAEFPEMLHDEMATVPPRT